MGHCNDPVVRMAHHTDTKLRSETSKKNKIKIKKKSETSIVNTFSYLFASMWKNEIKMQAFG